MCLIIIIYYTIKLKTLQIGTLKIKNNKYDTVKPRFNGLMRKGDCPLFKKTRILPSVDAQYMFWLKSLYYCYVAETYCT